MINCSVLGCANSASIVRDAPRLCLFHLKEKTKADNPMRVLRKASLEESLIVAPLIGKGLVAIRANEIKSFQDIGNGHMEIHTPLMLFKVEGSVEGLVKALGLVQVKENKHGRT